LYNYIVMKGKIISLLGIFIVLTVTAVAILYGRGYRLTFQDSNGISGTGILVLNSFPEGAEVYIDEKLTTATDNTINLKPGEYKVRIAKDGYYQWQKQVTIRREEVTHAIATLFPVAPRLEAVTTLGALYPIIDDSGSKIAFQVASTSAEKNGIYLLDMNQRSLIPFGGSISQIVDDTTQSFSTSALSFAPDGDELIATTSGTFPRTYRIPIDGGDPIDVTNTLSQVYDEYQTEQQLLEKKLINSFPKKLRSFAVQNMTGILVSPDDNKIFYTASRSATVPIVINPPLPGTNPTPETRILTPGYKYVYDTEEDKNYLILDTSGMESNEIPTFKWHANGLNLFFINNQDGKKSIDTVEFDGQNKRTLYAGPLLDQYLFPWPDGTSVLVLTNLNNPGSPANLYRIGLK